MSDPTRHRLVGFEPDNFLALLALLGLLRALDTARPDWRARAYWDTEAPPLRPVLVLRAPADEADVAAAAAEGVATWGTAVASLCEAAYGIDQENGENVRPIERMAELTKSHSTLRRLLVETSDPQILAMLHSLAGEVCVLGKGKLPWLALPTILKFSSGQMAFLGTMMALTRDPNAYNIIASLFSSWSYRQRGDTLRFSPHEAKKYALQAANPSPQGAWCEAGATILSVLGLPSFPTVLTRHGLSISGSQRMGNRRIAIRWPLWCSVTGGGCSLRSIESLLRTPSLGGSPIDREEMNRLGVFSVVEAERYSLVDQGDYYNISWGVTVM